MKTSRHLKLKKIEFPSEGYQQVIASPSKSTLNPLPSPNSLKLKPIQTLSALKIKPEKAKSSSSSPSKNIKILKVSPNSLINSKQSSRRTQSMNSDIINSSLKPANFISRCTYRSRVGQESGKAKKENQDSFIVQSNLQGSLSNYLFSVCDGHGVNGHKVSRYLKNHFPSVFESFLTEFKSKMTKDFIEEAYNKSISVIQQDMSKTINLDFSGSTMASVLVFSSQVTCANIGDSRAVLAKKLKNKTWTSKNLSRDHKPGLPDEKSRILAQGGRVFPYTSPNGPAGPDRVWLQNKDIPGLAMSRSIGDEISTKAGVINQAEFTTFYLSKEDCFIIIASDGLWEVVSSEEAVEIVGRLVELNKAVSACDELLNLAVKRWKLFDSSIDDITILIVFINN